VVFHPPSGAHNTLSTVSDIIKTVTTACLSHPAMLTAGSSRGLNNARQWPTDGEVKTPHTPPPPPPQPQPPPQHPHTPNPPPKK